MSSSDVSDLEEEKKKMKKDSSDSEDEKAKKKKEKKKAEKKKEEKKRKKKADSDSDSDSDNDSKKAKKKKKAKEEVEDGVELDDEDRAELGREKKLDVRMFKGRLFIDLREYYTDKSDGKVKPGKKGVCMNTAEWDSLKRAINWADRKIKKMS